ncbi:MAG: Maf family protein [Candidatus Polarisedimenticolia bacterium]
MTTERLLILASASPRRADLLRTAGLSFVVRPLDIDESPRPGERPRELAERLAPAKAAALTAPQQPALILAADTVVAVGEDALGKPRDDAEARLMLRRLAGRAHDVITAVAARTVPEERLETVTAVSRVVFAPLSEEEIAWYAATGEGSDKAGAYALQGRGSLLVTRIEGSYTNVIGLPLETVYPLLRRHGIPGVPRLV